MVRTGSRRSLAATITGGCRKGREAKVTRRNKKFRELGRSAVAIQPEWLGV
jgi:hypothetical protein